jgi:hypothetical protein
MEMARISPGAQLTAIESRQSAVENRLTAGESRLSPIDARLAFQQWQIAFAATLQVATLVKSFL